MKYNSDDTSVPGLSEDIIEENTEFMARLNEVQRKLEELMLDTEQLMELSQAQDVSDVYDMLVDANDRLSSVAESNTTAIAETEEYGG